MRRKYCKNSTDRFTMIFYIAYKYVIYTICGTKIL